MRMDRISGNIGHPSQSRPFQIHCHFSFTQHKPDMERFNDKKHVVEKLRSWSSSLEVAKESQILQRRCGVQFSPSLGEVRGKKKKKLHHLGQGDARFLPAGVVQCFSHQGKEMEPMNSLQYKGLITGDLAKNVNKLPGSNMLRIPPEIPHIRLTTSVQAYYRVAVFSTQLRAGVLGKNMTIFLDAPSCLFFLS